jgi:small redox-active disulfide protein 2
MKLVQILGAGCPKCEQLQKNAETAVKALGIEATIEKITEVDRILDFDVLMTPALVVDGEVKAVGQVLTPEEIRKLLA